MADFKLTKRTNLHSEDKEPPTLKLDFEIDEEEDSGYDPGDHLSIFPRNDQSKVEFLKSRLNNNPPSNRLVTLQVESGGLWESAEDFPVEVTFDDILNSLKDVLRHIGSMDTENVDKTFEEMRKNNRYQEDIFG